MSRLEPGDVAIIVQMAAEEDTPLGQISLILYDLTLLHDFAVIVTLPDFSGFHFGRYFWYRDRHRIPVDANLFVHHMSYGSPMRLDMGVKKAVAVTGLVISVATAIEKLSVVDLNRAEKTASIEKIRAETEGIVLDNERKRRELESTVSPAPYPAPDIVPESPRIVLRHGLTPSDSLEARAEFHGYGAPQALRRIERRIAASPFKITTVEVETRAKW
jgi:hypothetical protein